MTRDISCASLRMGLHNPGLLGNIIDQFCLKVPIEGGDAHAYQENADGVFFDDLCARMCELEKDQQGESRYEQG